VIVPDRKKAGTEERQVEQSRELQMPTSARLAESFRLLRSRLGLSFARGDDEADEVVQIAILQICVLGNSRGLMFQFTDISLIEEMEGAVQRLQLNGEVVLIANDSGVCLPVTGRDDRMLVRTFGTQVRMRDSLADVAYAVTRAISRQIAGDEATCTRDHVAGRAACGSKKQGLATRGISGQNSGALLAL